MRMTNLFVRENFRFIRSVISSAGKSYFHGGHFYGNRRLYRGSKFLRGFFGMWVEFSDMTEFIRRMEGNIFDQEEFKRAMEYVSAFL